MPSYSSRFVPENALALLFFRLGCCIFSNTWFVPDEYFQSVEVAYRMVYGIGHLPWEWSPVWALRSPLHPLLYAIPFAFLWFFGLDFGCLIRWIPHILQAFLFALADLSYMAWLYKLGLSHRVFKLSVLLYLSNWFILYCSTRTLSNTLECCLSVIALNWYEKGPQQKKEEKQADDDGLEHYGRCIACVTLATVLRPTAALLWAPLCLIHFWEHSKTANGFDMHRASNYIFRFLPYLLCILFASFSIDSWFYGRPTFCLWNFLKFNVLGGGSALFGIHPWHWYFTQGLPPVFGVACIPLLTHLLKFQQSTILKRRYLIAACIYVIGHTFISHKEHRFVLPIIPFILPYVALELYSYKNGRIREALKYSILALNLALIVYFGQIHQRGPYAANSKILKFIEDQPQNKEVNIFHLMPCFSLPMFAALHPHGNRTQIRMLDCGISLETIGRLNETDEADQFHASPEDWLNRHWFTERLYRHDLIITFEHTHAKIESFLMQKGRQHSRIMISTKIKQ